MCEKCIILFPKLKEEQYKDFQNYIVDGKNLPETFELWNEQVKQINQSFIGLGNKLELVPIEFSDYKKWCEDNELQPDAKSRMQYTEKVFTDIKTKENLSRKTAILETIANLDEVNILGYFESLNSIFITKFALISAHGKNDFGNKYIDPINIDEALKEVEKLFPHKTVYKSIRNKNEEIFLNLMDEFNTSILTGCWIVFELIVKSLIDEDYYLSTEDTTANFENSKFAFSKAEKKDLRLFYYLRNALVHYNGCYFKYRSIDHTFLGERFNSVGNEGNKIIIKIKTLWGILKRMEELSIKAWDSYRKLSGI